MVAFSEGFKYHIKQKQLNSELKYTGTKQQSSTISDGSWRNSKRRNDTPVIHYHEPQSLNYTPSKSTTMTPSPLPRHPSKSTTMTPYGIYSFIHLLICSSHVYQEPKTLHVACRLRAWALGSSRSAQFDQLCPWTSHLASPSLRCISAIEYDGWS